MTLQQPLSVEIDLTANAAYIRYSTGKAARVLEVAFEGCVTADLNDSDNVIGISVCELGDDVVDLARTFARKRGLAFPDALVGDADHYSEADES